MIGHFLNNLTLKFLNMLRYSTDKTDETYLTGTKKGTIF